MNALAIKDVEFNGTQLKAVQNEIGKIFVGVSWICNGVGFTKGQKDRQVLNIQQDEVLRQGCFKFEAGVFDPHNETLALDIEFLPLWLAKISITPKMKEENPELVEKLVIYQIKAKDVLAKAFLKEELISQTQIVPQNNIQTIQLSMPDMSVQFDEINHKIDKLYNDMSKFVKFIMDWKEHSQEQNQIVDNTIETYSSIMNNINLSGSIINDCNKWKNSMYELADNLIKVNKNFLDRKQVLFYIYNYMNKNYGIVWAQEVIDYKANYNLDYKPHTIDIVYNNETYKSIFNSILVDLISESNPIKVATNLPSLDDIIAPLVEKDKDNSPHASLTYRKVYKQMENFHKVSWKNHFTRCKKNGIDKINKKNIILLKPQLVKKFELSVAELLNV